MMDKLTRLTIVASVLFNKFRYKALARRQWIRAQARDNSQAYYRGFKAGAYAVLSEAYVVVSDGVIKEGTIVVNKIENHLITDSGKEASEKFQEACKPRAK